MDDRSESIGHFESRAQEGILNRIQYPAGKTLSFVRPPYAIPLGG
jgi:hypothetical protein